MVKGYFSAHVFRETKNAVEHNLAIDSVSNEYQINWLETGLIQLELPHQSLQFITKLSHQFQTLCCRAASWKRRAAHTLSNARASKNLSRLLNQGVLLKYGTNSNQFLSYHRE